MTNDAVSAKEFIAWRAAQELEDGNVVNLGIGIPTKVSDYIPQGIRVYFHTENGLLGVGPSPSSGKVDPQLINAGKQPVTETIGASFFDSSISFGIIRGGHIDVSILGGLQVDRNGVLANWSVPGRPLLGVGGAMDLLVGAKKIIVAMSHNDREGGFKICDSLTLPATAKRPVDVVITELAVFRFLAGQMYLTEINKGITIDEVRKKTGTRFHVYRDLSETNIGGLNK